VLSTIDFDNERASQTKINNVPIDRHLAFEFQAAQSSTRS